MNPEPNPNERCGDSFPLNERPPETVSHSTSRFHLMLNSVLNVLSVISLAVLALYDILAVIVLIVDAVNGGLPTSTDGEIGLFVEYYGKWSELTLYLFVLSIYAAIFLAIVLIYKMIRKKVQSHILFANRIFGPFPIPDARLYWRLSDNVDAAGLRRDCICILENNLKYYFEGTGRFDFFVFLQMIK